MLDQLNRRKRLRNLIINSLAISGALALFSLLGFVNFRQEHTKCSKLDVVIVNDDNHFLDTAQIAKAIFTAYPDLIGKELASIDIREMHAKLAENRAIDQLRIATQADGRCIISISERKPLMRIIDANGEHLYIDEKGFSFPAGNAGSARVITANGAIDQPPSESILEKAKDPQWMQQSVLDDVFYIANTISSNELWSAMIDHIHVSEEKKFELIPRLGNSKILLGYSDRLQEKLKCLRAFYISEIHENSLDQYSAINVEFEGQVVCTKRN